MSRYIPITLLTLLVTGCAATKLHVTDPGCKTDATTQVKVCINK